MSSALTFLLVTLKFRDSKTNDCDIISTLLSCFGYQYFSQFFNQLFLIFFWMLPFCLYKYFMNLFIGKSFKKSITSNNTILKKSIDLLDKNVRFRKYNSRKTAIFLQFYLNIPNCTRHIEIPRYDARMIKYFNAFFIRCMSVFIDFSSMSHNTKFFLSIIRFMVFCYLLNLF